MTRRSISDRARRRAIRAHAARLGVPYSVAARLLTGHLAGTRGARLDDHREWLFAMREQRSFSLRVRDTRRAVELPLGRAAHLVERYPVLRDPAGPIYDGEARGTIFAMLYAVLANESPALLPAAEELSWVAELGEEAAVDITCHGLDRAARLLLDEDRWRLWTRIEAALEAGEASADRRVRDAAIVLGREFRAVSLRRSMDGARQTLDALLITAHGGHAPGTEVRVLATGGIATVVGIRWPRTGPPAAYDVRIPDGTVATVDDDGIAPLDQPTAPEPALT